MRSSLMRRLSHADAQAKVASLTESANRRAKSTIADAEARALEVAGDAYRAIKEADQLKRVSAAMENVIEGYGDRYLVPTYISSIRQRVRRRSRRAPHSRGRCVQAGIN